MSQNAQDRYPGLVNEDGQVVDGVIYSIGELPEPSVHCKEVIHEAGLNENSLCNVSHCTYSKSCHGDIFPPPLPTAQCIRTEDDGKTITEVYIPNPLKSESERINRIFLDGAALRGRDKRWVVKDCNCCCIG